MASIQGWCSAKTEENDFLPHEVILPTIGSVGCTRNFESFVRGKDIRVDIACSFYISHLKHGSATRHVCCHAFWAPQSRLYLPRAVSK